MSELQIGTCCAPADAESFSGCGFDYLEAAVWRDLIPEASDGEFEPLLQALLHSPVPFRTANGFFPSDMRLIGPEAETSRALRYAEVACERAAKAGIRCIVFGSGGARRCPDGFSPETAQKQLESFLKTLAPIAERNGVQIVLEPLRPQECNLLNTVSAGAVLVQLVNHPSIRLLADTFHWMSYDADPRALTWAAHLIRHVHVASFPGRTNLGYDDTDLKPFLSILKHAGYRGRISFEGAWSAGPEEERKRRFPEFIRGLWESL